MVTAIKNLLRRHLNSALKAGPGDIDAWVGDVVEDIDGLIDARIAVLFEGLVKYVEHLRKRAGG